MLSLETLTWSAGPAVPTPILNKYSDAPNVYQMKDTFYLIGGYGDRLLTSVYEFDSENIDWKLRPEQLERGRTEHGLAPVPSRLARKLRRVA